MAGEIGRPVMLAVTEDDLWEVSTGVGLAIDLYDHTVRSIVAHIYLMIWQELDQARKPTFLGNTQPYDLADHPTICPN